MAKRRIVSVTPWLPSHDARYAGHKFYFEYLRLLTERFDVTVVASSSPDNEDLARAGYGWATVLVPALPRRHGVLGELDALRLQGRGEPVPDVERYLREMAPPPDVVELNWSTVMSLAPLVRRAVPGAYVSAIQHDRYSGTLQWSKLSHLRWRRRARDSMAGATIAVQERSLARSCDLVAAFKPADVSFAEAPERATVVLDPWVEQPPARRPSSATRDILFVGAFNRPENVEGALWLMDRVWPSVGQAYPDARLVLAGANPLPQLRQRESASVLVTGFVEDLAPYYQSAHCCVAPIFGGGGLRFKVAQGMCCALPLVATPEAVAGMESLPTQSVEALTTDPAEFAQGICRALGDPQGAARRGEELRAWANERFSFRAKVNQLMDLYEQGAQAKNEAGRRAHRARRLPVPSPT